MSRRQKIYSFVTQTIVYVFDKHLFTLNTFSGSVLMCFGDVAQQNVDVTMDCLTIMIGRERATRIAVVGTMLGSIQHLFYRSLDKRYPARDMRTIAKKLLIDQSLCTPVNIVVFLYGLGILENKTWDKMNEEFKNKFLVIFSVDCAVFIPSQYLNFKFIEPKYRIVFTNMVSIMYDTFLSYIKYTHDILKSIEKQNINKTSF